MRELLARGTPEIEQELEVGRADGESESWPERQTEGWMWDSWKAMKS